MRSRLRLSGLLERGADLGRNLDGLHRLEVDADGDHFSGAVDLFGALDSELEGVADGAGAELGNRDFHTDRVAEFNGLFKVGAGVDAGPADPSFMERDPPLSEEGVLGRFHPAVEIRKMGNPGEVGFVKLDEAIPFKVVTHFEATFLNTLSKSAAITPT